MLALIEVNQSKCELQVSHTRLSCCVYPSPPSLILPIKPPSLSAHKHTYLSQKRSISQNPVDNWLWPSQSDHSPSLFRKRIAHDYAHAYAIWGCLSKTRLYFVCGFDVGNKNASFSGCKLQGEQALLSLKENSSKNAYAF